MFIAFEGPDLVGKTTQVKLLVDRLRSTGHETLHLVIPSNAEFGEAARSCLTIRDLPLAERTRAVVTQACMIADRYAAAPEIARQLLRGRIVVADRWALSGQIYGEVDGLEPQLIKEVQAYLPSPDLEIVLTSPLEVLLERAKARSGLDRYERDSDFMRRILWRYNHCAEGGPEYREVLNGNSDRDGLASVIWGRVAALLRRKWG
jgi:dTMP kinase